MKTNFDILIIDDNKELAQNLYDILSENGYKTSIVYDSRSAKDLCCKREFDLALVDMKLPDIDGLKLIEILSVLLPEMEYIIITGYGTVESAAQAVAQKKIISYITKPIELRHLLSLIKQFTVRRQAEYERRQAAEELRFQGEIIANMSEGVSLLRASDAVLVYANPRFEEMFGYVSGELVGKPVSVLTTEKRPEEKAKKIMGILEKKGEWRGEVNNIKRDGTTFWCCANVSAFDHPEHGRVMIAVHTDITERKKAEAELKKLLAELERSNKELEQFAYVASHDLQEPLRTVSSFVQLLSSRYKNQLDANADEFITYITEAVTRMQLLIKDLLTLSRVDIRGKEFKPIDINNALRQVINDLHTVIIDNKAKITQEELPIVKADEQQIKQLFQNLIENAIKFRSKDTPEIHIGFEEDEKEFILRIRDNGIGIDPQFSKKIFVVFQRLHPKDKFPGTGIGLAICKKIVERHGGRIWFDSKIGKGSTFYFSIPKN